MFNPFAWVRAKWRKFFWVRSVEDKEAEHAQVLADLQRKGEFKDASDRLTQALDEFEETVHNGFKDRVEKTSRFNRTTSDPTLKTA